MDDDMFEVAANTIHRFWAGREMPEEYKEYSKEWAGLNPERLVVTWFEFDLHRQFPDLQEVIDDLYDRDDGRHGIELYVQLADVYGYALVARYGGIYLNCDIQPLRALPEMPDKAWASYENNEDGRIVNAAIGAPAANDPFWVGLLKELPARYWAHRYDEMVMSTGPAFLTDYAHAHSDQLYVFPTHTFNYVHWKQVPVGGNAENVVHWEDEKEIPEGVIALHHWGHKKDQRSNTIETATQPRGH